MSSALSSAYVLLGKATMSNPPDWSTAVGAIHTLSSLLTCTKCQQTVGPHPHATPSDLYSLLCDSCHNPKNQTDDDMLPTLMDNIKHLCSYVLRAFNTLPQDDSSEDDSDAVKEDIVIVPTYSSKTKFISKMVKFAKTYFDIKYHAIEENNGVGLNIINDSTSILHTKIHQHQNNKNLVETISVTAPPVPKAVVVTSPAKQVPKGGQWIKIHNPQVHTQREALSGTKRSHVMINGNKIGRDQIIKTTLRPSLSYPFKQSGNNGILHNKTTAFHKLSDYLPTNANKNSIINGSSSHPNGKLNDFVVHLNRAEIGHNHHIQIPKVLVSTKKGCRCGNASSTPGKLTCGGQRCPCYVGSRSCVECKCKGCKNPHAVNGEKVIRPTLKVNTLTPVKNGGQKSTYYITTASPIGVSNTNSSPNTLTTIKRIHLN